MFPSACVSRLTTTLQQARCFIAVASIAITTNVSNAQDVLPGFDFLRDDPMTNTHYLFVQDQVPANFFGPGSDPFNGLVFFQGDPLGSFPPCPLDDLTNVDTAFRRSEPAVLPGIPSSDQIPIEIVALNLVSVQPITVTYNGGGNPEQWIIRQHVSQSIPSEGTITVSRNFPPPQGGNFFGLIVIFPLFEFTKVSDPSEQRILDTGPTVDGFIISPGVTRWVDGTPPPSSCTSNFCMNPGMVTTWTGSLGTYRWSTVCPGTPVSGPETWAATTWGRVKSTYR